MHRATKQARYLRKYSTPAEQRLWTRLRNRQLAGLKFRRQYPVGNRIVDFFCAEAQLAVELDGSGHARPSGQTSDLDRELELYEKGIRVLRFYNGEVFKSLEWVLEAILLAANPSKSRWSDEPIS